MKSESLGKEIISNAPHLYCKLGVSWTSIGIGGPEEGNWIVSFLQNKHSDDFLVSINNEVASKLVFIFG